MAAPFNLDDVSDPAVLKRRVMAALGTQAGSSTTAVPQTSASRGDGPEVSGDSSVGPCLSTLKVSKGSAAPRVLADATFKGTPAIVRDRRQRLGNRRLRARDQRLPVAHLPVPQAVTRGTIATPGPGGTPHMSDWTIEAVDTIEKVVGTVRERTVIPARRTTKAVVFGLLGALCIVPAVVMVLVGAFRGGVLIAQGEVWAVWLALGGIFLVAGLFFWAKRSPRSSE